MYPVIKIYRERLKPPLANPGFLAKHRPAHYAATQDLIVPKEAVYRQIILNIPWQKTRRLVLVEFGFGPGTFLQTLIAALLKKHQPAHVIAFDLSPAMGDLAESRLEAAFPSKKSGGGASRSPDISVTLVTGVNCLGPKFSSSHLKAGHADAIFQIQFFHYAPNSPDSPLARITSGEGMAKITKKQWTRRVHRWLRPGGSLFDFNDFDSACPLQNAISLAAWDLWVLRHMTNPKTQDKLEKTHPSLANTIRRMYPVEAPLSELLDAVRQRREHRRTICREEVTTLRKHIEMLTDQFGKKQVKTLDTPLAFSHERFCLLLAQKT